MGDMAECFRDLRKNSQERRAQNRRRSAEFLTRRGIPYLSKNDGAHLIVQCKGFVIDFWPGTGKWKIRKMPKQGRGVKGLVNFLTGEE